MNDPMSTQEFAKLPPSDTEKPEDISDDVEQSRNSTDILHGNCFGLSSDFPSPIVEMDTPLKMFNTGDLLDSYGSLLSGQPRLRKICDDQEIYEVEGVDVDLETLQTVKMSDLTTDQGVVCVEPTIKFSHDYQAESSAAATNLAFEMQEDDNSNQDEFAVSLQEYQVFKPVTDSLQETPSPESSCGTLSPEPETFSPNLPNIKNNLDFPWTPLFDKSVSSGTSATEAGDVRKAVSKVRFRDCTNTEFVIPAAPGQTPFHRIGEPGRKSPYRVTPHPSTGRTAMPAALKVSGGRQTSSVGQSPSLKGSSPVEISATPQQGKSFSSSIPFSGGGGESITLSMSCSSEDELSPAATRVPNNTPVEGVPNHQPNLTSAQLEDFLSDTWDKLEDEGSQANRQQHNMKERVRRQRIKVSCDRLRTLIPGMTEKTDKATVFEFAAHYIAYLRSLLDHEYTPAYDKDFLKKATRLIAEEPLGNDVHTRI